MVKLPVNTTLTKDFIIDNNKVINLIDSIITDLRIKSIKLKEIRSLIKQKNNVETGYDLLFIFINEINLEVNNLTELK